jgi:hypothetical protein
LAALHTPTTYAPSSRAIWTARWPTPPACARDQHALSDRQLGLVGQRLECRAAGDGQRRGVRIVDTGGNAQQPFERSHDELRERAVAPERQQRSEHALADVAQARASAHRDDLAREVAAQAARRAAHDRQEPQIAVAHFGIERVERHRIDAHLRFALPRNGLGHLLDVQDVGRAVAVETQRAHQASRRGQTLRSGRGQTPRSLRV